MAAVDVPRPKTWRAASSPEVSSHGVLDGSANDNQRHDRYGCGVCRSACEYDALRLVPRETLVVETAGA